MFKTLLLLTACASVSAQANAAAQEPTQSTVRIGDSSTPAVEVLRKRKIEFHHCDWPGDVFTRQKMDDVGWLHVVVDKHRTYIDLSYSKSRGTITGMTVTTVPQQQHTKLQEIRSDASSITFDDDGRYSIHFLPAAPPKVGRSVYPPYGSK